VALYGVAFASTVAAPAQAEALLDFSTGPITVAGANEVVDLVGACTSVTITASTSVVRFTSATMLDVRGANNAITTGAVTRVAVAGSNNDLDTDTVAAATLVGSNNTLMVAGNITRTTVRGSDTRPPSPAPRTRYG